MKRRSQDYKLPMAFPALILLILGLSSASAELFDHSAQHCHDVSVWGEVSYKDDNCEKCETKFDQKCESKTQRVCAQVPKTTCTLVPYTDCHMFTEETKYNETEIITDGEYIPWVCSNFTQEEMHIKLVPLCVNVTRQDCVTKWVVNPNGQKVWDGNEECRPITWMNCTLHEEPKLFNQTYTKCTRTGVKIPTMQCKLAERTRKTTGMKCEVKSAVNCNCSHSEECEEITYQECREEATPLSCKNVGMKVPFQPKVHRVKCLLADTGAAPQLGPEDSAKKADVELDVGQQA